MCFKASFDTTFCHNLELCCIGYFDVRFGNDSCQVQIRSGIALFYQPNDIDVGLLQTISGKLEYADV